MDAKAKRKGAEFAFAIRAIPNADLSLLITSLESERVPTPTDKFALQPNGHRLRVKHDMMPLI